MSHSSRPDPLGASARLTPDCTPAASAPARSRYLTGRSLDVSGAYDQFVASIKWRAELGVESAYASFDAAEYRIARSLYPQWTGRRTRSGQALYVHKMSTLTSEVVAAFAREPERVEMKTVLISEEMVRLVLPLAQAMAEREGRTPVPGAVMSQSASLRSCNRART